MCALLALNVHFFDSESPWRTAQALLKSIQVPVSMNEGASLLPSSMPLNQARTPASWLKLQDQLTGKELIQNIKPGAHSLIAMVYDPMFIVLKGSSRQKMNGLSDFLKFLDIDSLKDHFLPFVLTVVIAAAGVTLLMNHLLLKEQTDELDEVKSSEGPLLTTQTLYEGHSLDVVMVAASPKGVVASVGLDRRIVIWNLRGKWGPTKDIITPACSEHLLWPVMALSLDGLGEWLAIAPRTGTLSFWQVKESSFYRSVSLELHGQTPCAFFFAPRHEDNDCGGPRLIVVRQNGWLSEVFVHTGQMFHHRIWEGIVVSSSHGVSTHRMSLRIVTASQQGEIFVTSRYQGIWSTEKLTVSHPWASHAPPTPVAAGEACAILPLPVLGMIVSSRSCNVELVDLVSGNRLSSPFS